MAARNRGSVTMARAKNSVSILYGFGLCCGCLLVACALQSRKEEKIVLPPTVVAEFDIVNIPVPENPVAAGTRLNEVQFTTIGYPRHQLPEDAIVDLKSVQDMATIASLPAKLPLFRSNLTRMTRGRNAVVDQIPTGMRAMTVKVDATSAVEGWAGTGAVVDVLLVGKERTTVIAERVKVLSSERSTRPLDGSTPAIPSTATLLVTQEQCLAINTAIPVGKIAFALRNIEDEQRWEGSSFTSDKFRGGPAGLQKPSISGAVSLKSGDERISFALSDGKWTRTARAPEGFLFSEEQEK